MSDRFDGRGMIARAEDEGAGTGHRMPKPKGVAIEGGEVLQPGAGGYRDPAAALRAPLKLTSRQMDRRFWLMAFGASVWDLFSAFLLRPPGRDDVDSWVSFHFGWPFFLVFVGTGIALTAIALWLLFIRTTLVVTAQTLSVKQWSATRIFQITTADLPVSELVSLFVEDTEREDGTVNDKPFYTTVYGLHARLANGDRKQLVSDLMSGSHARFFKQEIEAYLGIDRR
ncbi:hypothetical protein [Pendulispora albinea]|uniref:DUF304 domain-containing protein n=1 Tax=Pendulispora albinea TaxID=2741071 RepID=A0ABZ2LVZ2_9BACT